MNDLDPSIKTCYNNEVNKVVGKSPVILVDDSDVIKPYGFNFDSLGMVRDDSSPKKLWKRLYSYWNGCDYRE